MRPNNGKRDFLLADEPGVRIPDTPELEVLIEVPRGSFLKRGPTGCVDFVSPLPCPFNYGAVPEYLGLEGDLLDAVVLGPRLPFGRLLRISAWGAIALTDRGMTDHKLICSHAPVSPEERRRLLRFFRFMRAARACSTSGAAARAAMPAAVGSPPGKPSPARARATLAGAGRRYRTEPAL